MTSYCMQFTFAKKSLNFIYAFKCYQQIAINVGLSWPHFSWPTLCVCCCNTRAKTAAISNSLSGYY